MAEPVEPYGECLRAYTVTFGERLEAFIIRQIEKPGLKIVPEKLKRHQEFGRKSVRFHFVDIYTLSR
jgi:hypothetical protein